MTPVRLSQDGFRIGSGEGPALICSVDGQTDRYGDHSSIGTQMGGPDSRCYSALGQVVKLIGDLPTPPESRLGAV